jgi:hypothetical protein
MLKIATIKEDAPELQGHYWPPVASFKEFNEIILWP